MNCYAFLLLGISLTIYLLSNAVTVEEYGGRGRGRGYGRGYYGGWGYRGNVNPIYIYDEDYYQYPYWYRYVPFINYY